LSGGPRGAGSAGAGAWAAPLGVTVLAGAALPAGFAELAGSGEPTWVPWLVGAQAITVTANHADATGDVSIRKFIAVLVFELASCENVLGVNIVGDVHVVYARKQG